MLRPWLLSLATKCALLGKRKAMKISFILPSKGVSGGVRVTVVAANHLLKRGHTVRILIRRAPIGLRAIYRNLRDDVIYSAHSWLKDFVGHLESFKEIDKCKFEKGEIIVGVGSYVTKEMTQLQSLPNPKVQYLHGITSWDPELMKRTLSLPIPKIAVASYLVPLVESMEKGKVLAVIPNGIDRIEYFMSCNESEKDGVGTIYSSNAEKDPKTIISCIQKILTLRPELPIRIFGTEGKPKQLGQALYRRFPSVQQARELYSKSLVWIIGSMWEGFSLPVLEAMACRAVPVATDCGGTRDIIVDGENGFLVEVGNVKQIVDRVMLLLSDKILRDRMRSKAQVTADKFNWGKSIDELENALRKLC
jgi:glycosyltransferase involved in cell wall biosynthesis